jgi:putative ABC transport system substrate-binding protein
VDRRAFLGSLTGGLLAAPRAAEAQTAGKVYRIGYLLEGPPGQTSPQGRALEETLRAIGYLEGQNITLEARWLDRSRWIPQKLAAELVGLKI